MVIFFNVIFFNVNVKYPESYWSIQFLSLGFARHKKLMSKKIYYKIELGFVEVGKYFSLKTLPLLVMGLLNPILVTLPSK